MLLNFRQLRDIRQKIYLTELASSDVEGVQGQLHHAKCIYNALSDIKPEVENVIKMGRKIVESDESPASSELTAKIDALKLDFNEVGKQITAAKKVLERALVLAESLHDHLTTVQVGHSSATLIWNVVNRRLHQDAKYMLQN